MKPADHTPDATAAGVRQTHTSSAHGDAAAAPRTDTDSAPGPPEDPFLAPILKRARADHATLGVILSGSRGDDYGGEDSDYDLVVVVTDAEYERRRAKGDALREDSLESDGRYLLTVRYTTPQTLAALAAKPNWQTYGYVASKLLFDRDGAVAAALREISTISEEKAHADAAGWFDAYLNAFYRSIKAWRRGNEVGARLHAAHSVDYLAKTLFSLDRRWPPYHDRLAHRLDDLTEQGWEPGYLAEIFLEILRMAHPAPQQALELRVEQLMRGRGFGSVLDAWGLDIEWVKSFRSPSAA